MKRSTLTFRALSLTLVAAATLAVPLPAEAAGGEKKVPSAAEAQPPSPEEVAKSAYNRGITQRDGAWKNEKKALEADDAKKREKYEERARKAYEKAAKYQAEAIDAKPEMHEAHASLGYALRKLGKFKEALAAYDRALELDPGYAPALEYRGEAYLGLGRIDDAKQAYMTLFQNGADEAATLAAAMRSWAVANGDSPDASALADWLDTREEIAGALGEGSGPVGGW